MNGKNVAALATLLKKPEDEILKAVEKEGGLKELVSDFNTNNQVFDLNGFATLKQNLKKETIEKLEESDIPDTFKAKAVGWKLEKLEDEIKKKYQFTDDHNGLTDLVEKIVTKTKVPNDNEAEITALKTRIVEIEDDFKTKLEAKQNEFDGTLMKDDFSKALDSVSLDYEGDVLAKQKGLLKAAFNDQFSLKRVDGKTVFLNGENIVKDTKLDPKPLIDGVLGIAKDFGFQLKTPEKGGHGGRSSHAKTGLTGVSFSDYLASKKVSANTEAADKLFIEWKAANK